MRLIALLTATLLAAGCEFGGTVSVSDPVLPTEFPELELTEFATGFIQPTDMAASRDGAGRLFVASRRGVVEIVEDGEVAPIPFLDITGRVGSQGAEQGLLGIAFPSGGLTAERIVYVHYTDLAGDTVVSRFHVAEPPGNVPNTIDPDSEEILLQVDQPFANHNGGRIVIGPDGFMYIALGDGGSGGDPLGHAQDLDSLLGKILRIDVEGDEVPYGIPEDNPFGNEIWAYGLRNPWRFSFDVVSDDLFIADVGQNSFEEVNFQEAGSEGGQNYGWPILEGLECFNAPSCDDTDLTPPVFVYERTQGDCSVTGGFFYRGNGHPALRGIYLLGDFCSGRIRGLAPFGDEWVSGELLDTDFQISTFGQDDFGELYVADYATGVIYSIGVAEEEDTP